MGLNIIHISDIHIKNDKDLVFTRKNQIIAACKREIRDNSDVVILCTGDIAFSGEQVQYSLFESFINDISKSIKEEKKAKVSFLFVPGNHDCHFENDDNVRDTLISGITPEKINYQYFKQVAIVQQSYNSFSEKHNLPTERMISTMEIPTESGSVLFVLVNTAWMSVLNDNPGRIVIPKSFFPEIDAQKHKAVFALCHHPFNWLNPDYKLDYVNFIRRTADMVFVGHEHQRDQYQTVGENYSVLFSHAKELQDIDSTDSAFSVVSFDDAFKNYTIYDYSWSEDQYIENKSNLRPFHKNSESKLFPNEKTITRANDAGILINHFAKENVCLSDLFVWPDMNKITYKSDKTSTERIKDNAFKLLSENNINIIFGANTSGKTSIAKYLFLKYSEIDDCCVYVKGDVFSSVEYSKVKERIEDAFVDQYCKEWANEFWNLQKSKRIIIVDDFDTCRFHGEKRNCLLNILCELFGVTYIFVTSDIEIPSIMSSKQINDLETFFYYEILPLGNKKRKELISKWYHLASSDIEEEIIENRIDSAVKTVDTLLANGARILPAFPVFVICVLQNSDAIISQPRNTSQYAFLYESMIKKSLLSTAGSDYETTGAYSADVGAVSLLAFRMLQNKKTCFSETDFEEAIDYFKKDQKVALSKETLFKRMCDSKIFFKDVSNGELYRFRYPYIFYFFAGNYIAYNLSKSDVQKEIDYMSEHLYIEHYGNIMIFVCHFANNERVIESVLLNAYVTLENYEPLEISKVNTLTQEIAAAIDDIVPKMIVDNSDVTKNKDLTLERLDDAGINDGQVVENSNDIEEPISNDIEKDFASISASFKIMDVLGQILQNYPGNIDGNLKVSIIDELYKLGLRSVQPIIKTMGYLENDFAEFIYARSLREKKSISKDSIISMTKKFINTLIGGMVWAMINKIARFLNSPIIFPAVIEALGEQGTIASELILIELKVNELKKVNFQEIEQLSKKYKKANEHLAYNILSTIMAGYLNNNKCDYRLRGKICSLFGFSQKDSLKKNQGLLTERGYQ